MNIKANNMVNEYEEKKKIIQDIILKEEDIKTQLQRLVKLAKPFLSIEDKTGKVVLKQEFPFNNSEKIILFLLGKFFAYHAGIIKENTVKLSDVSDGLGIVVTTLSAPMARLVKSMVIDKPQKDAYQINPYHCEKIIEEMNKKFVPQTNIDQSKSNNGNPFSDTFRNSSSLNDAANETLGLKEEKKNEPK